MKICTLCGVQYADTESFCPRDGSILRRTGGEADDLVGEMVSDRYRVIRKLGEGGMGTVYLADQVKMSRKVALKVLKASMVADADAVSRFNREAANASRITHANVAAVYDFGEAPDGLTFLAMEFVDGRPLTAHFDESGRIHPKRAAYIVEKIADGLSAAHELGIVHRDLKPDNIMIAASRSGQDIVKVVDFGIAKASGLEGQNVTRSGQAVGTPEYMSPEQLVADQIDSRSDVYALGLVAFKMLTGSLPFVGATQQATVMMRLGTRPATLAAAHPGVLWPAEVQRTLDRALHIDAAQRYQHATEFASDLRLSIDRMLTALGSGATAVFPQARAAKNRPPRIVAIGVTGALCLAGGMIAVRHFDSPAGVNHHVTTTTRNDSMVGDLAPPRTPIQGGAVSGPDTLRTVSSQRAAASSSTKRRGTSIPSVRSATLALSTLGLSPRFRAQVSSLAFQIGGLRLSDSATANADVTLRDAPAGGFELIGRGGEKLASFSDSSSASQLLPGLLRYELSIAILHELDPTQMNSAIGLDLELGGGRTSFLLGQTIDVRIRATDSGYLTLIDADAGGTITVLHPSEDLNIGLIAANQDVRFDHEFTASRPTGTATLRAIVTPQPLSLRLHGRVVVSPDGPALAEDIRRAVLETMRAKGESWSTRSLAYVIR